MFYMFICVQQWAAHAWQLETLNTRHHEKLAYHSLGVGPGAGLDDGSLSE